MRVWGGGITVVKAFPPFEVISSSASNHVRIIYNCATINGGTNYDRAREPANVTFPEMIIALLISAVQ